MKKVAFWVPVRDKADKLTVTVESVLAQTYPHMEIILSDQGSTDDSLHYMKQLAAQYNGPNKVKIVQCPDTEPRGMAGFNAHLNWLHKNNDADIVICTSADDWNHPDRAKRVVEEFERTNASMVGTMIQFVEPDGSINGVTAFPNESRFVTGKEHLEQRVGGSSSQAWASDFYERCGPLAGSCIIDVYLPYLATQDRGFYFLRECLYGYIQHVDPNNTGLGGRLLAAKDGNEKDQINELSGYQITSTMLMAGRKAEATGLRAKSEDDWAALVEQIVEYTNTWCLTRDKMTMNRVNPIPLRA